MISIMKNLNITRHLTTEVEGKMVSVATLTGQVNPGKALVVSMTVNDKALAEENHADIAKALDLFLQEVRRVAAENDMPV